MTALKLTRRLGSNARKAFWLLKSFNHLAISVKLIEQQIKSCDELTLNFLMNILEQLSLVVYFAYENLVLLSRTQLMGASMWKEDQMDKVGNIAWLISDIAGFVSTFLHVVAVHNRSNGDTPLAKNRESVTSGLISLLIVRKRTTLLST